MVVVYYIMFFFKQKTAYEMRISDWSSDVCSSDLAGFARRHHGLGQRRHIGAVQIGDIGGDVEQMALVGQQGRVRSHGDSLAAIAVTTEMPDCRLTIFPRPGPPHLDRKCAV